MGSDEPYGEATARAIIRACYRKGAILWSRHAEDRMVQRSMNKNDAINVLFWMGGWVLRTVNEGHGDTALKRTATGWWHFEKPPKRRW